MIENVIKEALMFCASVSSGEIKNSDDYAEKFGVSRATVGRRIDLLRKLGVDIKWSAKKRSFVISDWGIFDKEKVCTLYSIACNIIS